MIKKQSKILLIGIILLVLVILVIVLKYKTKLFENFNEITNPSIPPPIYTMPPSLIQMPSQMSSQMPSQMPPNPSMYSMPQMPPSLPTSQTLVNLNSLNSTDIKTLSDAKQILQKLPEIYKTMTLEQILDKT